MFERRLAMAKLILAGNTPTAIIDEILRNPNINVSRATLWRDWDTQHEWMPELVKLDEQTREILVSQLYLGIVEERRMAIQTFQDARRVNNQNAQVGAIKQFNQSNTSMLNLLRITGTVPTLTQKLEITDESRQIGGFSAREISEYIPTVIDIVLEEKLGLPNGSIDIKNTD
jgi:hypothetical protein